VTLDLVSCLEGLSEAGFESEPGLTDFSGLSPGFGSTTLEGAFERPFSLVSPLRHI